MTVKDMAPSELAAQIAAGELWQVIDVRESWEVDLASVDGSMHVPMATVPERLPDLDPERPTAVLCHSGVRSARVADYLVTHGFQTVVNVAGGIDAWSLEVDEAIPRY